MPGQTGQTVLDRLAREHRPVDAFIQNIPDGIVVLLTREDPAAGQKETQLRRHGGLAGLRYHAT